MTETIEEKTVTRKANNKKLPINSEKTCDCKENHLNCLTAKDWLKSQLGVWQFNYESEILGIKHFILLHSQFP